MKQIDKSGCPNTPLLEKRSGTKSPPQTNGKQREVSFENQTCPKRKENSLKMCSNETRPESWIHKSYSDQIYYIA